MRKRLLTQIRAHQKLGTAAMFEHIDTDLKQRIDSLIKELGDRITRAIAGDDRLSETVIILRSIPGICPVASAMLIAEMPEIGTITVEDAAVILPVLTGRDRRTHAVIFSFMAGVTPPMPMLGRSLL